MKQLPTFETVTTRFRCTNCWPTSKTMTEARKEELIEMTETLKPLWKGRPATVAGFKNDYATVTTSRPGFWGCSWEAVERVVMGNSTLDQETLWLVSRAWLGSE